MTSAPIPGARQSARRKRRLRRAAARRASLQAGYTGRTATVEGDPRAWDWYKNQWLSRSRPSHADTYQRLQLIAATEGWAIASGKTYERRCRDAIKPYTRVYYRDGAQAAAKLLPPQARDPLCFGAGEAVNGDGLKFDRLWIQHADGEILNTTTVWFWQDIRTRRYLAWRIGKTECTDIFRLATYDLTAVCLPRHVWVDNTRVAANKLMTAGAENRHRYHDKPDDGVGLLQMLGMEPPHFTNPDKEFGSPGAKPIERSFGQGGIHEKVATNPALKDRGYSKKTAIGVAEFAAILNEEIARHNAQKGRRTAACGGTLSFDEAWAEGIARQAPRVLSQSQRKLLLMCRESVRPDSRSGMVVLKAGRSPNGVNRYYCDGLEQYMGRKLMAHFDPDDLSAGIHLYSLHGGYLFHAEHQASAAFNSVDAAREHAKFKKRTIKAKKHIAEDERRMSDLEAQALYGRAAKPTPEPPAEPAGNVVTGHFAKVPNPARDAARPSATGTDGGVTQLDRFIMRQSEKLAEDAL